MLPYLNHGPHHVPYGDFGEGEEIGLPGRRVDGGRAGRPIRRTGHVDADDEILPGVEKLPRTHQLGPPFLGIRIGCQGMADPQDAGLAVIFIHRLVEDHLHAF